MNRLYTYTILFFLLNINVSIFAQNDNGYLELKGTIKVEREGLSGAKIDVFENNKHIDMHTCDDNGKFKFQLELNKEYIIVVKKHGNFSKKLYINTRVPKEDIGIWSYKFAMELLPKVEGFDASLLDQPIGKIKFVDDYGDFDYDEEYTRRMQKKISSMMKEYEKMKKEKYKQLIAQADDDFNNGNYTSALIYYQKAATLDPYNPYPDDQISVIKKLQEKDKNKQESYDKAIAEADKLFQNKEYRTAKMHYNRALKYIDKKYPKDQIAFIDKYFADIAASEADAKAKEDAYKDVLATADRMFRAKKYETAMQKYDAALKIKPREKYPKDKIKEIQSIINQIAQNAKNKKELEQKYKQAIANGDVAFNKKQYEQAKVQYEQATQLKPTEQYPKTKLVEIDNLLAASKSKEEKYKSFITAGDQAFDNKNYEVSKSNYQKALGVKPAEAYPKQKIKEIDELLLTIQNKKKQELEEEYRKIIVQADATFEQKKYTQARTFYAQAQKLKPTEQHPKTQIAEINKILANQAVLKQAYDKALANADNNFNAQKWEIAKEGYQKALELMPNEQHPQSRLQEIEQKLLAMKNANEQKAAREKMYKEALAKADSYFGQEKYAEAKNYYKQALGVKPNEKYPKDKITEAENLMATMAKTQQEYNNKIQEATNLFNQKNYNGALATYKQAEALKPNEQLPKQKISEIQNILTQTAQNQQKYDRLMTQADKLFADKNYIQAQSNYKQALQIKPNEKYPQNQINKITELINAQKQLANQQKAIADKYKQKVAIADKLFADKNYDKAIEAYLDAKNIKPDEKYPDTQIAKINQRIKQQNDKLEKDYQQAIASGDAFVNNKKYTQAQTSYEKAIALKPNDNLAKAKLADLKNLMDKQKSKQQQLAKVNAEYKEFIDKADGLFDKNDFVSALAMYKSAVGLKPNDEYAKRRIGMCNKKIKQQKLLANKQAEEERKKAEAEANKSFDKKEDFDYKGEKRDRQFLNELAKKYPEGVTEENYSKPNKKIKRVIVNKKGIAKEYVQVTYSYGTFYFRNGQNISRNIFYSETKK